MTRHFVLTAAVKGGISIKLRLSSFPLKQKAGGLLNAVCANGKVLKGLGGESGGDKREVGQCDQAVCIC